MKTPALIGATAVVVAATLGVVTMGSGNAQGAQGRTLVVFEGGQGGTFQFIDNKPLSPALDPTSPRARFSIGDQAYWTGTVLNRRGGTRIGRIIGAETVVRGTRFPKVENLVHAIFQLRDGQLVVDAIADEQHPERVSGAIVGGTGTYEGARGTFTTKPGPAGNEDTFHLVP